jgi:hypothetical protein
MKHLQAALTIMIPRLSSSQEDCSMLSLLTTVDLVSEETISSPACSPQTKETAPQKRVRKTVDFESRVRVRAYLNRSSYSKEEMESAFMTSRDFLRSRAQLNSIVKKINDGSFKEGNEKGDCKLGLERYMLSNRAVREELNFGALRSVLFEQQELQQAFSSSSSRSMLQKTLDSSERIAQVYKEYSHQAQIYAHLRALETTAEALLEIQ